MTDVHPTARSWRNRNPLNLRPLRAPSVWEGQKGTDTAPGGPFAIFATAADGWAAAYRNLIAYQDSHGLRTIRAIVHRWAPSADSNDEDAYAALVSRLTGWPTTHVLDLHQDTTLLKLGDAMAVMEGGHLPWLLADKQTALNQIGVTHADHPPTQAGTA